MSADEEGVHGGGGGGPSIAGGAVAVGPPRNGVAMLPAHLLLQHFHDGGVDGEGVGPAALGMSMGGGDPGALPPDPPTDLHHRRGDGGPGVEGVGDVLELELGSGEAHHFRLTPLVDEDVAAAGDGLLGRGAVAGPPLCLHHQIHHLVHQAQEHVQDVQHGEDEEAHHFVHHPPRMHQNPINAHHCLHKLITT